MAQNWIEKISTANSTISTAVSTVGSNVTVISGTISAVDSNVTVVSGTISTLDSNVAVMSSAVSTMDSNVAVISGTVSTVGSDVTVISNTISIVGSDVAVISNTISTVGSDVLVVYIVSDAVSTMSDAVSTVDSNITVMTADISTIDSNIVTIDSNVTVIKGKTDYLQDMEDGVYFDSVTGGAGTDWPVGTAQSPSSVIASVITMCTARKTKKIYVNGAVTLGATMEGYTFVGVNKAATITLNSQDVDTSHFYNCTVTGVQGGTGRIYLHSCIIDALSTCVFDAFNCDFKASAATITPRTASQCNIVNGDAYDSIVNTAYSIIDLTSAAVATCKVIGFSLGGNWVVKNCKDAGNVIILQGRNNAFFISNNSNTAGNIVFYGEATGSLGGGGATEQDATLYTELGNPAGASISADIAAVNALIAVTKAGKSNMKVATCDLHDAGGYPKTLDLATCATQAVIIDSIVFSPRVNISDDAGAFTGISIQDNDTTVHTFISQANGIKANLTQYAQIAYTGAIKVRVGNKIQCTIYGASAEADPTTCDVEITYHAAVDGGTL